MKTNIEIFEAYDSGSIRYSKQLLDYLDKYRGSTVYVPLGCDFRWGHRVGNTTRQVNDILDHAYSHPNFKVLLIDHWEFEYNKFGNSSARDNLVRAIRDRINPYELEFFRITENYIVFDNKN